MFFFVYFFVGWFVGSRPNEQNPPNNDTTNALHQLFIQYVNIVIFVFFFSSVGFFPNVFEKKNFSYRFMARVWSAHSASKILYTLSSVMNDCGRLRNFKMQIFHAERKSERTSEREMVNII